MNASDRLRALLAGDRSAGALLLDGGLGSLLIARGLANGEAPERWLFERPDEIVGVHRAYVEAGCDLVHTATFGGSPPRLAEVGLEGRCAAVSARGAELARAAVGDTGTLIAGDVGPTGLIFPSLGGASRDELRAALASQIEALALAGVDLISVETMFDLREAVVATEQAAATGLPVFVSMTFERKPGGVFTVMGDRLVDALVAVRAAGAAAVGLNCSVTAPEMVAMVAETYAAGVGPLVAQPNAGQPRVTPEGVVYDAAAEPFGAHAVALVEAGAAAVGGCCGTTPDFLRAADRALREQGLR